MLILDKDLIVKTIKKRKSHIWITFLFYDFFEHCLFPGKSLLLLGLITNPDLIRMTNGKWEHATCFLPISYHVVHRSSHRVIRNLEAVGFVMNYLWKTLGLVEQHLIEQTWLEFSYFMAFKSVLPGARATTILFRIFSNDKSLLPRMIIESCQTARSPPFAAYDPIESQPLMSCTAQQS